MKHRSLFLLACTLLTLRALATNAPTNLNAGAVSSSQISLTWTDNSSDEIGFTFAFDTNAAFTNPTYVWAGGANVTSYQHTGLTRATTYYYKIKAEGNPDSSWTSVDSATTAPSSLAVTPASNSALNLTWSGNAGNANITGYTYAYATSSSFTNATYVWVAGNGSASASRAGLATATTYWVKIKAEGTSDSLDSPFGSVVTATTMPASLAATVMSSTQVNLSWSGNGGNASLAGYTVAKATNSSFSDATYHYVNGAGATAYSATGLSANTTYYFKVKAEGTSDAYDSPFTVSLAATTSTAGIPNPPSNLAATATSSTRVDLSWTDNSDNETGFELKRATDSAFTQNVVWIGGIVGTTYGDTGRSAATTYYYKVRAEGAAGKSAYSNTVSVTTPGTAPVAEGVPISPRFFGINAWMPCAVGNSLRNGKLYSKWPKVQESRVRSVRYGGIAVDEAGLNETAPADCLDKGEGTNTREQYVKIIDAIRGIGAEPIIQVAVTDGSPEDAAALVDYINGTLQKGVKYWSIGNEPDLLGVSASSVAAYIRNFSAAMKYKDASIKIVAPETAWFNWGILDALTNGDPGTDVTGRDPDTNRFWIDVISFHTYPFPKKINGVKTWPSRSGVIAELASFDADLARLKERIAARNSARGRTGDQAITIAVTEANINYDNPSDDHLDGVGATSFLGGQFWAEMLGIAMQHGVDFFNFWSVIEGNSTTHDKGYLSRDGVTIHPSYYHFEMMAEHFRGNAIKPGRGDGTSSVKAFAAKDTDQAAVILINMDGSSDYTYTVVLNGSASSGQVRVNVPANLPGQASGTIAKQSTILLVFNNSGAVIKTIEYKRYGANGQPSLTETP